jgi:dienelactone hydrolase
MPRRTNFLFFLATALVTGLLNLRGGLAWAESVVVHDYAGGDGFGLAGKIIVPEEPGTYPLAIVSHGWASSGAYFVGWGKIIASLGFVVVVPSFPSPLFPDWQENTKIIERLVEYYRQAPAGSPAHGKVDPKALALVGHSGGGYATSEAAMALKPAATVLLDPVSGAKGPQKSLEESCGPVLTIFAEPGACNEQTAWDARVEETTGPRYSFRVKGSSHCDGEKPPRSACGPFCSGAATPKAQAEIQRYMEAMLQAYVLGDESFLEMLEPEALGENPMLKDVNCAPLQESCVTLPWENTDTGSQGTDTGTDGDSQGTGEEIGTETDEPNQTGQEPQETDDSDFSDPPSSPKASGASSSCSAIFPGKFPGSSLLKTLISAWL